MRYWPDFFSSENWDFTGFGGRNFYRQHLRNFYLRTSEIRDFGQKLGEKSRFWLWDLLPVEISTGLKFLFFEKYGVSASFCTSNQVRSRKTRKSRFRQSWWISKKYGRNPKLKKRRPKQAREGRGYNICIKIWTVGPNDLIFFPSENWAQTGFGGRNFYRQHPRNFYRMTVEIRDFGRFGGEISRSRHWILLPPEISTGPKCLKIEKYGISASFCTLNQYRSPKTRKSRTRQS
jgi:hypothetical protein